MQDKINIYLDPEDRKAIDKKMSWYKVSLSTIVDKVCEILIHELGKDKFKLYNEFYYKPRGKLKTSCKPKCFNGFKVIIDGKNKTNIICTNCLLVWLRKDVNKITDDTSLVNRIYSLIDNKLNNTIDKFWNYNEQLRNTRRMIKDDPEYWQKVVEENKK